MALFFQGFASQLYNESLKDRSKETQWNLFFPCREWSSQPLVAMTTRSLQPRVVLATTRCDEQPLMVLAKRQRPPILSRRHWFAFANYLGVIGYI